MEEESKEGEWNIPRGGAATQEHSRKAKVVDAGHTLDQKCLQGTYVAALLI